MHPTIWWIVAVLAAIALIIFIVLHVDVAVH
jgi:hypothetical protein